MHFNLISLSTCKLHVCRTVEAAEDAEDCILRAGARLNLPLQQVSDAIASQGYNLAEPPMGPSPWVDELCLQLAHFKDRLAQVKSLSDRNQRQVTSYCFHIKRQWFF